MAVFDFKKTEERIRDFWDSQRIFEKSLEQRKDAKRFVFFEGPPTANGLPHIGHFLTRIFKDLYGRYKTMRGFYVLRKAGWDTHGLPVEIEIEKELGFKNKKQIEEFGIDKFNKKAKESVWKYKKEWEDLTERMAFWLDLKHPYITYETHYIESVWAIIKKISDRELLYQAHRVVPYCTRCGTGLSSHEVAQGYKVVKENSIYLKFKLKSAEFPNTAILAWTTTPWTLPGNVALAIGKDIEYIVAKKDEDRIILAKELLEKVAPEYSVEKEMKGKDLVGLEYEPLFDIPQLKSEKSYCVYAADFVSTQDGTGVVHTAVMYGEDDYKLGTELGLPKVHTVDEQGKFIGVSPELDGKYVRSKGTEEIILDYLRQNNLLFKEQEYEHDYPFCWRCDTALLYYARNSWFIKMSAVNKEILENNEAVNWIPEHIKHGRFGQWLKEGKDWAFSRERYWGTPLPAWQCDACKKYFVAGSLDDLEKNRADEPTTFYLIRHGESTRGIGPSILVNSYPKHDTYDLTEQGREQVQKLAQQLASDKVDVIVTSSFKRTQQTAQIIAEATGASVQIDERLGELRHGLACEGKPHNQCDLANPSSGLDTEHSQDAETRRAVRTRMMMVVRDLARTYPGKKIALISHGDPLWMLASAMLNLGDHQTMNTEPSSTIYPQQGTYQTYTLKNYPYNDQGEVDLHRPYVDEIVLKCNDCGGPMHKIPDLIDVWFDSGAMPYAQWHWPFENEQLFQEQFPADYIVEAVDQTRGWFYTLLAIATLLGKGAPYKNVMVLGHTLDEKGKKMSKSKGNTMLALPAMDTYGADTLRWYFFSTVSIGDSKAVIPREIEEKMKGFLTTLENCVRFYELYEKSAPRGDMEPSLLDQWMLSRLNRTILEATEHLDHYDPTATARMIEKFVVDDLSKWWLRRSRNRPEAIGMLRYLLFEVAKLTAPFIPYTAEDVYHRVGGQEYGTASVHLLDWPQGDKAMVNDDLEKKMQRVQEIITAGLAIRKEKQIKVRQPLGVAIIPGDALEPDLEMLVKDELNVKKLRYKESGDVELDLTISPELQAEGYAREMIRQIQDMRKEAKYDFKERALVHWDTQDSDLVSAVTQFEDMIEKETILRDLIQQKDAKKPHDIEKEVELTPGKKVWIGIQK